MENSLTPFQTFVVIAFLFFFGGVLGWFIELIFRRFFDKTNPEHLWLNPGFLTGPCLPVYGFGAVALFSLSLIEAYISVFESYGIKWYILMFIVMALIMTAIEFIAGIIFIKGMHIQLWDYSEEPGNIMGIICPKFTFFWGVLSALYYFVLFPPFLQLVIWFIEHPWFSFAVGVAFGIFVIDCAFSMHLGTVLRKRAKEIDKKSALNLRQLHSYIRHDTKISKFFSLHSEHYLTSKINSFEDFMKRTPMSINKD